MTVTPREDYQSQLSIDTSAISSSSPGYDTTSVTLGTRGEIVNPEGVRGTRSRHKERTRDGKRSVGGQIELYPSAADLLLLVPLITGSAFSTNVSALAEALTSFNVCHDKGSAVLTYAGCVVDKATFSCAEGQAVKLVLELLGLSDTPAAAGTFPGAVYNNTAPYMYYDATLTLVSAAREVKNWSITYDNLVEAIYNNHQYPSYLLSRDRLVTFQSNNPFDTNDLYAQASTGSAASLALSDGSGGHTVTFNFGVLQFPREDPSTGGRKEITQDLRGVARMSSSTRESSISIVTN